MQRTKIFGTEIALPTTAGTASSISESTCVRLYNGNTGPSTVSISSTVGAADTASFTMPQNTVEFLEKPASYVIWSTSSSVKAAKVGFTN